MNEEIKKELQDAAISLDQMENVTGGVLQVRESSDELRSVGLALRSAKNLLKKDSEIGLAKDPDTALAKNFDKDDSIIHIM